MIYAQHTNDPDEPALTIARKMELAARAYGETSAIGNLLLEGAAIIKSKTKLLATYRDEVGPEALARVERVLVQRLNESAGKNGNN